MNKEKLKGVWEKAKTALGKVSKKMWIVIGAAAAVLLTAIVATIIYVNTRPYATLIADASNEEAAAVVTWLQEQGVKKYRMEGTGTILVPEGQAPSLKARLLQERYSSDNGSYTAYFERVSALSTVKDRENAWLITLVGEMEKTIEQFPGVQNASVTINLGEDRGYVLDTNNVVEATAGVLLTMQKGQMLSDEQANAIRNYIASGVAGLKVSNVSIEDTDGNPYVTLSGRGTGPAEASELKLYLEQQWSNRKRQQILQALEPIYGKGNVSATVNCTVELGDKTVNDYQVKLPEFAEDGSTNGAGILDERAYAYQFQVGDDYTIGGVVGTATNSDLPTYVEQGENVDEALRRLVGEGNIKYDNSKTQTQMIITAGTLTNCTVTVGINSSTAGQVNMDQIREAASHAVGIEAPLELPDGVTVQDYLSRYVTVINDAFFVEPEPEPEPTFLQRLNNWGIPTWVFFAAIGGLVLFAIVLTTVLLLVRRGKRKKERAEQQALEELLATAMPPAPGEGTGEPQVQLDEDGNPVSGADVMDLHTERSMELRQSIRDFVDENMEVAALLIKSWLKEDGDNG